MVPVPVLCFDGDSAGQKAAMRAAMRALPLLRPGFSLSFATLPAGQDPDDIVRARGATGFTEILEAAQPLVERLWAHEVAAGPLATPEERAALKTRLLTHADAIQDADVRHHYREAFRERLVDARRAAAEEPNLDTALKRFTEIETAIGLVDRAMENELDLTPIPKVDDPTAPPPPL